MNFPSFIARRYLFSKKSHQVITFISMISVFGVATGTMALIIVLSVFNGFDNLIKSVFSTFDPDLRITVTEGKVFDPNTAAFDSINVLPYVDMACFTLEENVLLEYETRMTPAVVKGVPPEFKKMSGVDTMVREGSFVLNQGDRDFTVIGAGISYFLSVGLNFVSPIEVYVPKRSGSATMNPATAFNKEYILPSGIFSIQQDIDSKYILVPMSFARRLLGYDSEVTAMEIKLKPETNKEEAQEAISELAGSRFTIKNRYQQHEVLYRVMKSEKFAIYLILTFILIVASFNIIGSLSMLIIDKKNDIYTFRSMGLDKSSLQKIFLYEGWMISIFGALIGLFLGALLCWLQLKFGFIRIGDLGTFLVDSFPVKLLWTDFALVFLTVVVIGLVASWYPVKYFTNRYLQDL